MAGVLAVVALIYSLTWGAVPKAAPVAPAAPAAPAPSPTFSSGDFLIEMIHVVSYDAATGVGRIETQTSSPSTPPVVSVCTADLQPIGSATMDVNQTRVKASARLSMRAWQGSVTFPKAGDAIVTSRAVAADGHTARASYRILRPYANTEAKPVSALCSEGNES